MATPLTQEEYVAAAAPYAAPWAPSIFPHLNPIDATAVLIAQWARESGNEPSGDAPLHWPPESNNPGETGLIAVGALPQTDAKGISHHYDTLAHGVMANVWTYFLPSYASRRSGATPEDVIYAAGALWRSGTPDVNQEYSDLWLQIYNQYRPYADAAVAGARSAAVRTALLTGAWAVGFGAAAGYATKRWFGKR